jgi:AraC-like DNA-binding protein
MGTCLFGRPTADDARQIMLLFNADRHPAVAPTFDSVSDGRHLESINLPGFTLVANYIASRADEFRRRIRRHALVLPHGLPGAVMAGTGALTGAVGFSHTFTDLKAAFDWLERDDATPAYDEVSALLETARCGGVPEVTAVRAYLASHLSSASLEGASRMLGCSTRALQRALASASTSFRAEVTAARLKLASDLLGASDEKIATVAERVGFDSAGHFTRWFRQQSGVMPSQYRARYRR